MASFKSIIARLQKEEQRLAKQLAGIHQAISSLEFGGGGAVVHPVVVRRPRQERRPMSAAQRKAVSARMKKYWAKRKRAGNA